MTRRRNKIALIGGGQIGTTIAMMTVQSELGDVVLLDLPDRINPVKGKALDMLALRPNSGFDVNVVATSDYCDIEGADVVVVTAGLPRRPGMTREDLIEVNLRIIESVAAEVSKHASDAFVIVTTNPVDTMTQAFHHYSGMDARQIVGLSGALDTNRFKNFIAMESGLSVKDVSCLVMGGHGPTMVPIIRTATVAGIPIADLLSGETIEAIVERTRNAGTEIVELMGQGSAYFSSAGSIIEMIESVLFDKKRVIACSTQCNGEFGLNGYFMGVPTLLGADGVERIVQFPLTETEQQLIDMTAESVKKAAGRAGVIRND